MEEPVNRPRAELESNNFQEPKKLPISSVFVLRNDTVNDPRQKTSSTTILKNLFKGSGKKSHQKLRRLRLVNRPNSLCGGSKNCPQSVLSVCLVDPAAPTNFSSSKTKRMEQNGMDGAFWRPKEFLLVLALLTLPPAKYLPRITSDTPLRIRSSQQTTTLMTAFSPPDAHFNGQPGMSRKKAKNKTMILTISLPMQNGREKTRLLLLGFVGETLKKGFFLP